MLGATCPHAVYPQFPQAISSTATEQRCFGQRAGDNLWIPRGFLEESTGCPRIHAQCAQLAGIWGPSWGRAVDAVWTTKPVHSRPRFILELSPGHPQADTRCDLGKPAESTVSTGPITTPVLHLENFSSKQVVWTSLERTAPPRRAGRRSRGQRGRGRGAQRSHPRATTRCCTDLPIRAEPGEPESLRTHCGVRSGLHSGVRVTVRPAPHAPHPKIRNPVLTSDRTSGAGSACATSLSHRWQEQPPRHRGEFECRPPHREPAAELSTPLPWDDCGYGHTLGCARLSAARRPDDPQRPHPLVHPQLSTADRPRQGRYDWIRPPGLAGTPPDDVSSTRRGSRPRSSKRGTV